MAETKKKSGIAGTIVFVALAALFVIGIYMSLTRNKNEGKLEADVQISEASNLIAKDLKNSYPGTAREVMKLYCRITQCLYSDDLSDKEIEDLIDQLRMLYADELLAENDRDTMIGLARGEIKHYNSNTMTINSYNVEESGEITYFRNENPPRALIDVYFTIKNDKAKSFERAYEEFVLIEDDNSHWKILGWRLTEE